MGLIFEGAQCAVCRNPIDIDGSFFCTTALPNFDMTGCHELSDAPIHWECLWNNKEAEALIDHSFKCRKQFYRGNQYWQVWVDTQDFDVATNGNVVRVQIRAGHLSLDLPPESWLHDLCSLKTEAPSFEHLPTDRWKAVLNAIDEIRIWQEAKHDASAID